VELCQRKNEDGTYDYEAQRRKNIEPRHKSKW